MSEKKEGSGKGSDFGRKPTTAQINRFDQVDSGVGEGRGGEEKANRLGWYRSYGRCTPLWRKKDIFTLQHERVDEIKYFERAQSYRAKINIILREERTKEKKKIKF